MEENYDSSSEDEIVYNPIEQYNDYSFQHYLQNNNNQLEGYQFQFPTVDKTQNNSYQNIYEEHESNQPNLAETNASKITQFPKPTNLQYGLLKQEKNQKALDGSQQQQDYLPNFSNSTPVNKETNRNQESTIVFKNEDKNSDPINIKNQGQIAPHMGGSPLTQVNKIPQQPSSKKNKSSNSQNFRIQKQVQDKQQELDSDNNKQTHQNAQLGQPSKQLNKGLKAQAQKQDKKPERRNFRKIYNDYQSKKDIVSNLSFGRDFQGKYRVNSKNHTDGYVQIDGLPHQVLIKSLRYQNRAIDGDIVVIQILPDEDWFVYKFLGEGEDNEAKQSANLPGTSVPQTSGKSDSSIPTLDTDKLHQHYKTGAISEDLPQSSDDDVRDKVIVPPPENDGSYVQQQSRSPRQNYDLMGSSPESEGRYIGQPKRSPRELNDIIGSSSGNDTDTVMGQGYLETIQEEAESLIELEEDSSIDMEGEDCFDLDDLNIGKVGNNVQGQNVIGSNQGQTYNQDQRQMQGTTGGTRLSNHQKSTNFRQRHQQSSYRERQLAPWWQAESQEDALKQIKDKLEQKQQETKSQIRITGKIVGIQDFSNRREHVVGSVFKIFSGPKNWSKEESPPLTECLLQVQCIDQRLPNLLIVGKHLLNLPALVDLDFGALKNKILFGKIQRWSSNDLYPTFHVASVLGQRGILGDEVKALLFQENIEWNQYPDSVMAGLDLNVGPINQSDLSQRRDYRDKVVFTIDPLTAKDLDDAISIEKIQSSPFERYLVQVHIADVSHFVPAKSALNEEAQNRSTSVYLVNSVIPMLPPKLCEYLCSLNPGKESLTYTIEWEMDLEGKVYNLWIGKSIIKSCVKLSYNLVQEIIEKRFDQNQEYFGINELEVPKIKSPGITWNRIIDDCLLLHKIAQGLRKKRFDDGALRLDLTHLYFDVSKDGLPQGLLSFEQKESNQLIEEFALKANTTIAGFISSTFPQNSLLRNHPPPDKQIQEVAKVAQAQGIDIKVSNSKEVQESLLYIKSQYPELFEAFTSLLVKPMQNASYISTGSPEYQDPATWHHYALCISFYTHFTSPIRRYPDIVVHRLVTAALQKKAILKQIQRNQSLNKNNQESSISGSNEVTANGKVGQNSYDVDLKNDLKQYDKVLLANNGIPDAKVVSEQCEHYNGRKLAAKSAQEKCVQIYLLHHLCMSPSIVKGIVTRLGGCHFLTVYVPQIGQEVRVKLNALNVSLISVLAPNKCVYVNVAKDQQDTEENSNLDLEGAQFTHKKAIMRSQLRATLQSLVHRVGQDKFIKNRKPSFQNFKKFQTDRRKTPRRYNKKPENIQNGFQQQDYINDDNVAVADGQQQRQHTQDSSIQLSRTEHINKPKWASDQQELNWQQQLLQQKYGMDGTNMTNQIDTQQEMNSAPYKFDGAENNGQSSASNSNIINLQQGEYRFFNQYTNTYHKIEDIDKYNTQQLKEAQGKVAEVKIWDKVLKGDIKNKDSVQSLSYPIQINQFQEVPLILFSYMSDDDVTPKFIGAMLYIEQPNKETKI